MDSLNQVHFLYQYSLRMFLDMFSCVLYNNSKLNGITDYQARLNVLTSDLFTVCYERVARGMLHTDRLTFALLLCRIHLKGVPSEPNLDVEFNFFLRGKEGVFTSTNEVFIDGLTIEQQEALTRMSAKYVIIIIIIECWN